MRGNYFIVVCLLCLLGIRPASAQAPVADFSASSTAGCGPLTVKFTDNSTNTPTSWEWDFGNGTTSSSKNPSVTYITPGSYTVTLIAKNASGADAMRKTNYITVYAYPTPSFSANLTLACVPSTIQFADKSTPGAGSIDSWTWDFGDGTTSSQQNPIHNYTQTGYYDISLKVSNTGGCSNTLKVARYLRLVSGVQPNFSWNQTSTGCAAPFVLQFVNQTAGPGIMSYTWNLGNSATPATSTAANPSGISYPAAGSYTITLNANSDFGCSGQIQQTITLANSTAVINGPTQVCLNTPVSFVNGSSPAPSTSTWVFNDGSTSTGPGVSNSFTAAGTYTLKLVNNYSSCADSTIQTITAIKSPTADFSADQTGTCQPNLTVHFTDKTTPTANQWSWDFGDGTTSTLQNPAHTYSSYGSFDVKLTIGTAGGCSNTITKTAFINVQAPTITLAGTSTLGACVVGTPTNTTIAPIAQVNAVDAVTSYAWTATGATPSSSNNATPSFQYASTGAYSLSLTITTAGGCSKTATFSNVVRIGTPTTPAITAIPDPVCGKQPVTFSDNTTPADQWIWSFGDGQDTTLTKPSITHSYRGTGNKTVSLSLVHQGCPQTTTKIISVTPPIAGFSYAIGCPDAFNVTFTDTSFEDNTQPITYLWNFGDPASGASNTSTLANPIHEFTNPGGDLTTYLVQMIITNGSCSDTTVTRIVLGTATAAFTPDPYYCYNQNFTLVATGANPTLVSTYSWEMDNNGQLYTSTFPYFTAVYLVRGPHPITLTVTDIHGCKVSVTHDMLVGGPISKFLAPNPAGGCKNQTVTFTDASSPYTTQPITSWQWSFGDGTSATTNPTATHIYADTGTYNVSLKVDDGGGCSNTYSAPIQITHPQALFSGPDSFYCPQEPLTFKDTSKGYQLSESWDFGDGTTSPKPVHAYPAGNNTYTVKLTVTDKNGCQDYTTGSVKIQSPIAAVDIADTTAICIPLETQFTAKGQYYDSLYWDFGDGTTSTLPTTSHFYNALNTFTATLFLRGPGGCLASTSRNVYLLDPQTTKLTYGPPLRQCDSIQVAFSLLPPAWTRYTLNFGDGSYDSSGAKNITHEYRSPGNYGPSVALTDSTGCIVNIAGQNGTVAVLGSVPFFAVDKKAFCDQGIVNFTDYSISNDGVTSETYTFGDGSPSVSQSTGTANFNTQHDYTTPGFWPATLKVVTNSGCTETYTDTIAVYPTPHPVIQVTSLLCTGLIQFAGSITQPAIDTVIWSWTFGNGSTGTGKTPSANYAPGSYNVTLKTSVSIGCSDQTSYDLTVLPLPAIIGPREIATPVGIPITIPFTYSSNVTTYSWTPADNISCTDCPNPIATLINSERYRVTVTDDNSCVNTDTILIKTICNDQNYFLPNTFSPNGDGVNDIFYPRGSNLYNIQSMQVFNRWGQKVFERKNFPANAANMGWDGSYNGRPAPSDAYVYIVEVICNNSQTVALHGNVTLVR